MYEQFIAVEGAPNGSSEGTPAFEVEIKDALEFTIKLPEDTHGGAIVSVKDCTKQFNKR